ncbi:MAG TPA: archaeosortase/exosortase family protein, partial [Candidatus Obscuribacterales bacterium]
MRGRYLPVIALAGACWPTLMWYAGRLTDGCDEPWGLVSLATLVALAVMRAPPRPSCEPLLGTVTGLLILYASAFWWAPPLVRAIIAVTACTLLLSPQIFGDRFHLGAWALAVLSLPLLSSLQFYLGYPLRLGVSMLTASLLGMAGFSVSPEGAALAWAGQPLVVDAPCSGIRMLWVTLYLAATLSCLLRLDAPRTLVLLGTGG